MIPRRAIKSKTVLVAALWEVREGTHFPKIIGQYTEEAAALAAVAEKPHGRSHYVIEWKEREDPRVNGYNVEFQGAMPAKQGQDY
jgi:hypothetical protein